MMYTKAKSQEYSPWNTCKNAIFAFLKADMLLLALGEAVKARVCCRDSMPAGSISRQQSYLCFFKYFTILKQNHLLRLGAVGTVFPVPNTACRIQPTVFQYGASYGQNDYIFKNSSVKCNTVYNPYICKIKLLWTCCWKCQANKS